MYKCLDCGHIFEEGEQKTIRENHTYGDTIAPEYFSVCPCCGCDFEETKRCNYCLDEFLEDELIRGYCKECLRDALTVKNFLMFSVDGEQENKFGTLEDFVFSKIFRLPNYTRESSAELKKWCRKIYVIQSSLDLVMEYMDEIPFLLDDFAEYLNEAEYLNGKEVKK